MQDREVQDKFRRLVRQLVLRTEKGTITWTDTGDPDGFRTQMRSGMVRVQKRMHYDEDGHEMVDYSLTLLDPNGKEVEDYYPDTHAPGEDLDYLAHLWNLARRSSRGSLDVLDELLKETALEER
jgi:hypothetical protein